MEQVAARIHWPVETVTGHGRLELKDLLEHYMLLGGRRDEMGLLWHGQKVKSNVGAVALARAGSAPWPSLAYVTFAFVQAFLLVLHFPAPR